MHLGVPELLVILLIVLLFFGPSRLPQLASSLGAAVRGFKRAANGEEEQKAIPDQNAPSAANGVASSQPQTAQSQSQNPPPQA